MTGELDRSKTVKCCTRTRKKGCPKKGVLDLTGDPRYSQGKTVR